MITRYGVLRAGTAYDGIGYLCSQPPQPAWNGNYHGVEPANHDWRPVPSKDMPPDIWYCTRCRRVEEAIREQWPEDAEGAGV